MSSNQRAYRYLAKSQKCKPTTSKMRQKSFSRSIAASSQSNPQHLRFGQKQPIGQNFGVLKRPYRIWVHLYLQNALVAGEGCDVVRNSVHEGSIAEVEEADVEEDPFSCGRTLWVSLWFNVNLWEIEMENNYKQHSSRIDFVSTNYITFSMHSLDVDWLNYLISTILSIFWERRIQEI